VYSCYLICIRKEHASGYKGYKFADDMAVMSCRTCSVYSSFLMCRDSCFLSDISRFIKCRGTRWLWHVAHVGEREMHGVVYCGNLKESDHLE
jgi:hypothetical protein